MLLVKILGCVAQFLQNLVAKVRREKINERMKLLQDLVLGCNKLQIRCLKLLYQSKKQRGNCPRRNERRRSWKNSMLCWLISESPKRRVMARGHKEWVIKVNLLGVIEHPNLVKLLSYCADDDERGIQRLSVYEYMPNGSVEDHLSPRSRTVLSWPMRLKIAQDAARGLVYLHEEMDFQVIFCDFKSSNILLDDQWKAKLSDFGFARFGPLEGKSHVTTPV